MPPRPFIEIPRARALVARSADLTAMQPLHARSPANATETLDPASAEEQRIMSKMARRLLPILVVMFLIAFIDRQNVGFAKLQMVHSPG